MIKETERLVERLSPRRRDRTGDTREDLLREISYAENILDGMNAKQGVTLWGRIASIKDGIDKDIYRK